MMVLHCRTFNLIWFIHLSFNLNFSVNPICFDNFFHQLPTHHGLFISLVPWPLWSSLFLLSTVVHCNIFSGYLDSSILLICLYQISLIFYFLPIIYLSLPSLLLLCQRLGCAESSMFCKFSWALPLLGIAVFPWDFFLFSTLYSCTSLPVSIVW